MFVSTFDLYRIGPGPSSVHTVGPMRAARRFVHALEADGAFFQTSRIHVDLYGSVACTGRDQGTDSAIIAGLSGDTPETADPALLASRAARASADGTLALAGRTRITFDPMADLVFHVDKAFAYHSNALRFTARNGRGEALATRLFFSTGDGDVLTDGETAAPGTVLRIPCGFATAVEMLAVGREQGKKATDMVRANEQVLRSPGELLAHLTRTAAAMHEAIERGLATDGMLPGGLRRPRRAAAQAAALAGTDPSAAAWAAVYATAVAEENAAGGRVVAAPSNGAAGPIAGVLELWRTTTPMADDNGAATFLLGAAAIGQLLRQNGIKHSGCQGEVGVAAAMAAAGLAAAGGATNDQLLFAAERALEPHLGMACDPVGGLVQDPCIARNAAAAAVAVQSARLALRQPAPPRPTLDTMIRLLVESGREMAARYKESSLGGIAVNVVDC
ncbi:MAG: L-serine ammonia-lyase [Betaproteobacteria bacterium]